MTRGHTGGRRLWMNIPIATMALLLSARSDEAAIREKVARKTLDKAPLWGNTDQLNFSVPYPVVKAFLMDTLFPALDKKEPVPVRLIRSEWIAYVSISNNIPSVELLMNVDVLDASPFRPVMLDLFPESTIYEEVTIDGHAVTPVKLERRFRNNGNSYRNLNQGLFQTPGQSLFQNGIQMPVQRSGQNFVQIQSGILDQTNSQSLEKLYVPLITTGRHCIRARIKPNITKRGPEKSLVLFQNGYALANIHFTSEQHWDVRNAHAPGILQGAKNGTAGILSAKAANSQVELRWAAHREPEEKDGLPSFHTSTAWTIEERALTARSIMDVRITGGSLDTLNLTLPTGADRIRISGADVRDTRINGSSATVFLKGRIKGATRLNIACTIPGNHKSTMALPTIGILGGRATDGGWLTVANDLGGQLLENSINGFEPIASLELPPEVSGLSHVAPTFFYRRESRSASVRFDLVQTAPFPLVETIADKATGHCVVRPDGLEIVKLHYAMRNNRGQFLEMKLPAGARLLSVAVEEKMRTPSARNGNVLIPLPRSLQTMDGLISFPVDVAYLRKAEPLDDREQRRINLPELIGVPTAQVSLTLFLPDELQLKETQGPLEPVDDFTKANLELGYGFAFQALEDEEDEADPMAAAANTELYRNYYALGLEFYKKSDFENAERYLEQAVTLGDDAKNNADAFGLLNNIKIASGTIAPTSARRSDEGAKAKYITRSSSAKNVVQESVQSGLIAQGLEQIAAGDELGGAVLLEEADKLGRQLSTRGEARQQVAIQAKYVDALKMVKDEQRKNERLQEEFEELQQQAQTIVAGKSETAKGKNVKGQQLFANISAVAQDTDYDGYAAEGLAFGWTKDAPAPSKSVKAQNEMLEKQVKVLKKALERTENQPVVNGGTFTNEAMRRNAKGRISETRSKLNRIITDFSDNTMDRDSGVVTFDDALAERELKELKAQTKAITNVYGTDEALSADFSELGVLVEEGEKKLQKARQQRKQSRQVAISVSALQQEGGEAPNIYQQQQLAELIVANNDFVVQGGAFAAVEVIDGNLAAANFGDNAVILNDAISNLSENQGNVVSFAGTNFDASVLETDNPVSELFDQQTAAGKRYAVLDEAQFRTLNNLQTTWGAYNADTGQRVVVPNTPNRVAGQDFRLEKADASFNGISINGTIINLEHDRYLAIDNGGVITILKGSEQHNWQEKVDLLPELLPVDVSPEIIFPAVGNPYRFEKTLLAEGESMDLVIQYRLARTD